MEKDELVHEIGGMLLKDEDIQASGPWHHLAMVVQFMTGSTEISGFVYRGDGEAVPAAPDNFDVLKKFRQLREAMREPGKEPWKAALVRIDDASRRISIDFEYDHPEKWLIVPSTVKQMAEVLRPAE